MNLSKTYIRMPVYKNNTSVQMTLDNDFNVPDTKPDIERLIQEKGTLHIRDIKPSKDKCIIRGELAFGVLYMGDDGSGQLQSIEGAIPFEETVNMDGLQEMDQMSVRWDMEDLRTGLINSRKISVRSIVVLHVSAIRMGEEEVADGPGRRGGFRGPKPGMHSEPALCQPEGPASDPRGSADSGQSPEYDGYYMVSGKSGESGNEASGRRRIDPGTAVNIFIVSG